MASLQEYLNGIDKHGNALDPARVAKYREKYGESDQWNPSMPSRGLGDVIAKITHATGIDRVVEAVAGKDCGCKKRQKLLNDAVPFQ